MNLNVVRDNIRRYGLTAGVHDLTKKAVNRLVPFRVLKTMELTMDGLDPSYLDLPQGFEGGFADLATLLAWAADPANDLDADFAREASVGAGSSAAANGGGDRCYAITRDGALASYGWYSRRPTMITEELRLHFDARYVYMYKGYTLPEHRGKRLHAIGMARALEAYAKEGTAGIVSYVESNNFASLKSCYRMGYRDLGAIVVTTVGGRTFSYESSGCKARGLRVEVVTN